MSDTHRVHIGEDVNGEVWLYIDGERFRTTPPIAELLKSTAWRYKTAVSGFWLWESWAHRVVPMSDQETRCMVCDSDMRLEEIAHETHVAYRWHCTRRDTHGKYCRIPRQWRGPNVVATMRYANEHDGGYVLMVNGEKQTVRYPVDGPMMIDLDGPCPACGASWQGEPIPEDWRQYCGGKTHYSRLIGIEIPEKYDGVWLWRCPDCAAEFPRFPL